jgi:hypothetical protein
VTHVDYVPDPGRNDIGNLSDVQALLASFSESGLLPFK